MTIGLNRINILFHYLSKKRKLKRVGKIGIRMFFGNFSSAQMINVCLLCSKAISLEMEQNIGSKQMKG